MSKLTRKEKVNMGKLTDALERANTIIDAINDKTLLCVYSNGEFDVITSRVGINVSVNTTCTGAEFKKFARKQNK